VKVGVYPGSFNPPTLAHLAIADAACHAGGLEQVDLVVSVTPLGKQAVTVPTLDERLAVLEAVVADRPHLGLRVTEAQLLVDIAADADAVVLGADKWDQINDPVWYGGSVAARDEATSRLPLVLVAPRPPFGLPLPIPGRLIVLDVEVAMSSTGARAGHRDWMAPAAAAFDEATGAWTDPARYRAVTSGRRRP
jgi:Cytidylyltransferase-like